MRRVIKHDAGGVTGGGGGIWGKREALISIQLKFDYRTIPLRLSLSGCILPPPSGRVAPPRIVPPAPRFRTQEAATVESRPASCHGIEGLDRRPVSSP